MFSVRTVDEEENPACSLSEIAQPNAMLLHFVVAESDVLAGDEARRADMADLFTTSDKNF